MSEKAPEIQTQYDKTINEKLRPYIFDESKVLDEVPFVQFKSKKGNRFCYGLLLPKYHIDDKTGEEMQLSKPVILSSYSGDQVPIFQEIRRTDNHNLGVKFEGLPSKLPNRYSLVVVPKWLHMKAPEVSFKEVFEIIQQTYKKYIFCGDIWYDIHACWDIATYFYTLFNAFPYLELRGIKGSAKTKVMRVSRCFSFNPSKILTNPSESSLFRSVNDQRPTLYLDECERLFNVVKGKIEHDGRVEILNSGYDREGNVPRVEKIGNKFVTIHYATYCPKVLASINGLQGATEDRSIIHIMTRAPDDDIRGERDIDQDDPRWREVRDKLFFLGLSRWMEVEKTAIDIRETDLGIKKRNHQLWCPVLTIARLIDDDLYDNILSYAQKQQELSRADDLGENSWEMIALKRMYELVQCGEQTIYLKDLADAIPEHNRPNSNRALARALDKLGLRDKKGRDGNGTKYEISGIDELKILLGGVSNSILSSLSSLSSHSSSNANIEVSEMKMGEDSKKKVKMINEDNEDNEANEDCNVSSKKELSSQVSTKKLSSNQDVFEFIVSKNKPVSFNEIKAECGDQVSDELLESYLIAYREKGDLYNPKPDCWRVV